MFKPRVSPKEGRPGNVLRYSSPARARRFRRRGALVIFTLVCILWWIFFRPGPVLEAQKIQQPPDATDPDPVAVTKLKTDGSVGSAPSPHEQEVVLENTEEIRHTEEQHLITNTPPPITPMKATSGSSTGSSPTSPWVQRPSLDAALARVVHMLPDEMHMRELTRKFETGGSQRMRELGLRTRQYQDFFSAWEDLHLIEDASGGVSVRDDIIQYILGTHDETLGDGSTAGLAQTLRDYEAFRSFMANFANSLYPFTSPYFADHMTLHTHFKKGGRGIVLTAGDDQAPYLLTTIPALRRMGCRLPIEVMYLGDGDLGEDYRAELEELPGVVTRDIAQMIRDDGWELAGWAAKPFAILVSSFREVIFIDADSLFFKNPEALFEDPEYQRTGALFFRDRLIMPESKRRFLQQLLPRPIPKMAKLSRFWTGESGHMQESGVVVVDKWRHFIAMLLVCRLNGSDRDAKGGKQGVYDLMYGDKETFWIGFLLAGDESFAFHQGDAAIMGETPETAKPEYVAAANGSLPANHTICSPQLLHMGTDGEPLWFNGWLLDNKFADKHERKFARFESYLVEPRELREPTPWELAESNKCCLTSDPDKLFEFTEEHRAFLEGIIEHAKEISANN